MMVDIIVFFIFLAFVTTLRTCEKVDDTMDSKDNNEEKTRERFDIMMYYFNLNFFH